MTPGQYSLLCRFAYLDLPDRYRRGEIGLEMVAGGILMDDARGRLPCGPLADSMRRALSAIQADETLGALRIVQYANQNKGTGFVAYAFREEAGGVHLAFRGSETTGCFAPNDIDWVDNFAAPFRGSVQYAAVEEFTRMFDAPCLTGHSKGAHNALYALGCARGDARAVVFNGQGFSPGQISSAQKKRLARRAVNYVTTGDVVGALLQHPERRVFVETAQGVSPHSLDAFVFDGEGDPVEAPRPAWSYLVEMGTRLYLRAAGARGEASGCEIVHN